MLHKETVDPKTLDLIRRLLSDEHLREFVLVGGTALSLQVGHRISIDIDLFTDKPFDSKTVATYLSKNYQTENIRSLKNGIFCFIDDVKVDIMSHQYPWVGAFIFEERVRMVGLEDIAAMKLNAIVQSGSRLKDFVDVYVLLNHLSFNQMYSAYEKKYPDANKAVVQNALMYHADIKPTKIDYVNEVLRFEVIGRRLSDSVLNPSKTFQQDVQSNSKRER
jgi:hypothetical protein